jgi:hypothetical protein
VCRITDDPDILGMDLSEFTPGLGKGFPSDIAAVVMIIPKSTKSEAFEDSIMLKFDSSAGAKIAGQQTNGRVGEFRQTMEQLLDSGQNDTGGILKFLGQPFKVGRPELRPSFRGLKQLMGTKQVAADRSIGSAAEGNSINAVASARNLLKRRRHGFSPRATRVDQRAIDIKQENFHRFHSTKVRLLMNKERTGTWNSGRGLGQT